MKFWHHIVSYFRRENGSDVTPYTPRYGATSLFPVKGSAMSVATVFRCVKLLSESIANLPLQYQKRKGDIFQAANNPRLEYLLNVQPDFALNAFDFWRQVGQELILDGNAYIVPVYNNASMELDRLALCGRGTVSHDTINDYYFVNDVETAFTADIRKMKLYISKG